MLGHGRIPPEASGAVPVGPGDDKSGYASPTYVTQSRSLDADPGLLENSLLMGNFEELLISVLLSMPNTAVVRHCVLMCATCVITHSHYHLISRHTYCQSIAHRV